MRFVLQSIAAGFGALTLPVIGLIWFVITDPAMLPDGTPDNAPRRAAMVFLFASPIALVALSILFAILVAILRLIGHLSLRGLLASCAILALAPVVSFTSQDLDEFGLANMLISLASFWTLSFVSLGLGTITWWLLARSTTSLRASSATPGAG